MDLLSGYGSDGSDEGAARPEAPLVEPAAENGTHRSGFLNYRILEQPLAVVPTDTESLWHTFQSTWCSRVSQVLCKNRKTPDAGVENAFPAPSSSTAGLPAAAGAPKGRRRPVQFKIPIKVDYGTDSDEEVPQNILPKKITDYLHT